MVLLGRGRRAGMSGPQGQAIAVSIFTDCGGAGPEQRASPPYTYCYGSSTVIFPQNMHQFNQVSVTISLQNVSHFFPNFMYVFCHHVEPTWICPTADMVKLCHIVKVLNLAANIWYPATLSQCLPAWTSIGPVLDCY